VVGGLNRRGLQRKGLRRTNQGLLAENAFLEQGITELEASVTIKVKGQAHDEDLHKSNCSIDNY
jgi:hypothetical protein